MKLFSWVTKDTSIDFMKARKFTYALSIAMCVLSIVCICVKGFNFGIDFSGGILMELKADQVINLQAETMDEKQQMAVVNTIKQTLGSEYEYRRVELVGPQVGDELKMDGVIASIIAVLAISAYIWFRFEWQFALGAMIGLIHDILTTLGVLSLFGFDFSLTTVAAILTLAGYSVNDTVVTYDRVRENLRKFKKMPQIELLNKSINDIFSRTILTGLTTLLAALALFVFGGDTLKSFSFVIVWGVIVGTYSSIYVSAVFLNLFDLRKHPDEKAINPFGNVE